MQWIDLSLCWEQDSYQPTSLITTSVQRIGLEPGVGHRDAMLS